ncbi:MAG: O-antigen ligase family protein [Candidatus Brocadiae bacterium]|nr:O-antigen ligase family protein [Candidatus Brocadiia bacterium]
MIFSIPELFPKIVFALLCLEVVFSSLFFGAVHSWAWSSLTILSCLMMLLYWYDKTAFRKDSHIPKAMQWALLAFLASLLLSWWNPVSFILSPRDASWVKKENIPLVFPGCLSPYHARLAIYQWIIPIVAFLSMPYILSSRKNIYLLFIIIIIIATLQGIYGTMQYFFTEDPIPFFVRHDREGKVTGTYICRNTYSCFLAMAAPLILGYILDLLRQFHLGEKKYKILSLFLLTSSFLFVISGNFLSLSRGGILCLIAGIALWMILMASRKKTFFYCNGCFLVIIISSLTGICWYFFGYKILQKFDDSAILSLAGRWEIWKASYQIWQNHFFFGVGGGNFFAAWEIHKPLSQGSLSLWYAHNDYLQFLVEYGIFGFLSLFYFIITWVFLVFRQKKSSFLYIPDLFYSILVSLCVIFLHGTMDFSLNIPGHRLLCAILMGTLLSMTSCSQQSKKK